MEQLHSVKHFAMFIVLSIFLAIFLFSAYPFSINPLALTFFGNANASLSESVKIHIEKKEASEPDVLVETLSKEIQDVDLKDLVEAPSAFSIRFENGQRLVLFEKSPEKELPMASLAKLMTALVVFENYDLDMIIPVSSIAMAQIGEQGVLKEGEMLSVDSLLRIMLIESSNRAAYALSEFMGSEEFVVAMNRRAKQLGLLNTYFKDSTGLSSQSYSTAKDLSMLAEYLVVNFPLAEEIMGLKTYDLYIQNGILHHTLINTNKLLGQDSVIGGKTGWTNDARGCMLLVEGNFPEYYSIHIVLGAEDRFGEIKKIMDLAGQSFTNMHSSSNKKNDRTNF
jgi:serine-type D-Ala-D-Ala carboxypeptidase (penicillin-binding protein 5/6)